MPGSRTLPTALGLALVLWAGLPVTAAEMQAACSQPEHEIEQPVELCGETTIESSTSGRVRVLVPSDATIDLDPDPAISGEGRTVGFLLTEPGTREGFYAQTIRFPSLLGSGVSTRSDGQKAVEDREEPSSNPLDPPPSHGCSECHIPPGQYDLYLIADGKPLSMTLRFSGLSGRVSLTGEDLSSVNDHQIGFNLSGSLDTLRSYGSHAATGGFDMGPGLGLIQFVTHTDTETVARATHRVCLGPSEAGSSSCDEGSGGHTIVGAASPDGLIGWRGQELAGGSYDLWSLFEATNTVGTFTWERGVTALLLEY